MTVADRVAITGLGIISALGIGQDHFRDALRTGRSGIRPLAGVDTASLVARHAGRVSGFIPHPASVDLDRYLQMAFVAASEALADSGVQATGRRIALVFSTCIGPLQALESPSSKTTRLPSVRDDPESDPATRFQGGAILLARRLGITGPITTVTTACAASASAIGRAADLLRTGRVDAVLVGGADAFSVAALAGFDRLRTTSPLPCAPFSEPPGMTLSEGAGFWVLEPESLALARTAPLYGFVLGHGLSSDAHHPTAPDPTGSGIRRAIAAAISDAGISAGDLGYVNAHGSGTLANDRTESRAIARAFESTPPPTGSTKAALGHALGAAGILEATASLLSIGSGLLPPTLGFTTPREGCELDCVPNVPRPTTCTRFMSLNLAFHGHNAAIVLATPRDPPPEPRPKPEPVVIVAIEVASKARSECRPVPRGLDHVTELALNATRRALTVAKIPDRAATRTAIGLVLGRCAAISDAEHRFLTHWHQAGPSAPDLATFPFVVPNASTGTAARMLGLKGWSTTLCAGHGAGLDALACAADAASLGHADCIAAGAADLHYAEVSDPPQIAGDAGTGTAAVVVLERAMSAAARGVPPLARVAAWAAAFLDMTPGNDPTKGMIHLLARTLNEAAVPPDTVGACCLSSDQTTDTLAAAAAYVLPARIVDGALLPQSQLGRAHGTAPLLGLATILGGSPAHSPIIVASLSRHGEARVVVLAPPDSALQEASHA